MQKLLRQVTSPLFAMGTILRYSVGHSGNQAKAGGKAQANARPSNHIQLIEAICAGTEEEAVQALRKHLTRNWKTTRRNVEELLGTTPAPESAKHKRKKV